MKNKLIEAIREAAYYVRSLSEIDGRPHDFRTDDGHIMIVDFNIRRWTDETDEEFLKQFAEYDRGFIETLKRFMERNYKDFKACGLDGNIHVISAWAGTSSVHDSHVISACSVT